MKKRILSPGTFLPGFVGKVIAHVINAAKTIEAALNDLRNDLHHPRQLQRAVIKKRYHNNRKKTDGRDWYAKNH